VDEGVWMDNGPEVRIELKSNPIYLSGTREMVAAVARRLGFLDEACGQIALAVDEALCNVIRHGYGRRTDRPIWITLRPLGGVPNPEIGSNPTTGLEIMIEDDAKQVDPCQIRSRDLEEVRPGGLGVHIIRAVMDEVRYEKRDGAGMRLVMVKHRAVVGGGTRALSGPSGSACRETTEGSGA